MIPQRASFLQPSTNSFIVKNKNPKLLHPYNNKVCNPHRKPIEGNPQGVYLQKTFLLHPPWQMYKSPTDSFKWRAVPPKADNIINSQREKKEGKNIRNSHPFQRTAQLWFPSSLTRVKEGRNTGNGDNSLWKESPSGRMSKGFFLPLSRRLSLSFNTS